MVVSLVTSLSTVACLAAEQDAPAGASADNESALEEILENPLADADYRDERSCLRQREIDSIEIVDENLIVFRGRIKKSVWANRFPQPCVGLRRDMVVTTGSRTGSICRLDAIDARPRAASPFEPPVRCFLGGFIAIDEVQAEAMKRAAGEHAKAGQRAGRASGSRPGPGHAPRSD